YTVECAFGERPFEVTEAANPFHLQLRTQCEMWHKENLLNLMIARLPTDWQTETVQQLQHYDIVQLFAEAHDLRPNQQTFARYRSFASSFNQGIPRQRGAGYYGGAPGRDGPGDAYYHLQGVARGVG